VPVPNRYAENSAQAKDTGVVDADVWLHRLWV
ncbi:MAG: hypothetical protein RLZZ224_1527, partial [Verrucomicrobiota bacterium]